MLRTPSLIWVFRTRKPANLTRRALTKNIAFFVLVEYIDSSTHKAVSLFYDSLKLRHCRELFYINNVNRNLRHGNNKLGYLLIKFVLCLQDLLVCQLQHSQ